MHFYQYFRILHENIFSPTVKHNHFSILTTSATCLLSAGFVVIGSGFGCHLVHSRLWMTCEFSGILTMTKLDLLTVWSQNLDILVVQGLTLRSVSKGELGRFPRGPWWCPFFHWCWPPDFFFPCPSHCAPVHQTIPMCSPFKYLPSPFANFSVRHVSPP